MFSSAVDLVVSQNKGGGLWKSCSAPEEVKGLCSFSWLMVVREFCPVEIMEEDGLDVFEKDVVRGKM